MTTLYSEILVFLKKRIPVYRIIITFICLLLIASCSSNQNKLNSENKNQPIDSLSYFENSVSYQNSSITVIMYRAKFYARNSMLDKSVEDLEYCIRKDSMNLEAHKLYADIHLGKLNLDKAKMHYEFIIEKDTLNAASFVGLGKMYAILDNNAAAIVYLNKALMIDPYLSEPYFMKGMIYRSDFDLTGRLESWTLALSSFQTAVEQDPNNYSAYVQLGIMHDQMDDSLAIDYYNSALDIYPESMEAWYNKGMFFQNRGRTDEAINCYRTILTIDSTWAEPYYNLGYINLLITENLDSSIYFFNKAVSCDPTYYQAYNNIGLAYEKKNDFTNARFYYTKSIEINPDYKLAKDNLNRLVK